MCVWVLSHVQVFATPWTVAHQAPLFLGFPGKNTGVVCKWDLPDPGIEPMSLKSPALAGYSSPLVPGSLIKSSLGFIYFF